MRSYLPYLLYPESVSLPGASPIVVPLETQHGNIVPLTEAGLKWCKKRISPIAPLNFTAFPHLCVLLTADIVAWSCLMPLSCCRLNETMRPQDKDRITSFCLEVCAIYNPDIADKVIKSLKRSCKQKDVCKSCFMALRLLSLLPLFSIW